MIEYMSEILIKINRAIQQPFSNVILVGAPGLGKAALSRLAIYTCRYNRYEIPQTVEFNQASWRVIVKEMVEAAVGESKCQVLDLSGGRIINNFVLDDMSCLMKTGRLPGLF